MEYWLRMRPSYPNLARLSLYAMTIIGSSCDCERMFSEPGNLLEPTCRKIGSVLLLANFKAISSVQTAVHTDAEIESEYRVQTREQLLTDL